MDKRRICFKNKILKGTGPETFIAILNYYRKGKYFTYKRAMMMIIVEDNSFTSAGRYPYSKDNKDSYLYFKYKLF